MKFLLYITLLATFSQTLLATFSQLYSSTNNYHDYASYSESGKTSVARPDPSLVRGFARGYDSIESLPSTPRTQLGDAILINDQDPENRSGHTVFIPRDDIDEATRASRDCVEIKVKLILCAVLGVGVAVIGVATNAIGHS